MPVTQELMEEGEWTVSLKADTPRTVLDAIDVRTYAYSSIVITPLRLNPDDVGDAAILAAARYTGVYLAQTDGRLNLEGKGLIWWLGQENDGGAMIASDGTFGNVTISSFLSNNVLLSSVSNGLSAGTVNAAATLRTLKYESGTTRRQLLDTACAAYADPNYEWRVNPDGTVDVNTQATLYPTVTTPTAILTQEGGRDGNIEGVRADLALDEISVEDYRTNVQVDWSDGTNNGSASNTPPSTWKDFAGSTPVLRSVIDSKPRNAFRENPRWSIRRNANRYGAWIVNALAQANNLAKQAANNVNTYDLDAAADIDEYDPWRFIQVGDSVWVYDLDLGIVDTANQVYYRGSAIHPLKLRVQSMQTPIQEGYGVYLRRWTGAAFDYYDLSDYVEYEEDATTLQLGLRTRFHRRNARPKRYNMRRIRSQARRMFRIQKYVETVS